MAKRYSIRSFQDLEAVAAEFSMMIKEHGSAQLCDVNSYIAFKVTRETYDKIINHMLNRTMTYANKESLKESIEMKLTLAGIRIKLYI